MEISHLFVILQIGTMQRKNSFCCQIQSSQKYFCLATITHLYLILNHRRHYVNFHQQVALNIKIGITTFHLGKPWELRDEREKLSRSITEWTNPEIYIKVRITAKLIWIEQRFFFAWNSVEDISPLLRITVLKSTSFRWTLFTFYRMHSP